MGQEGRIKTWKDDKGYGFVASEKGGPDIFLHISAFTQRRKRPEVGDLITYELLITDSERPRAANVLFMDEPKEERMALTALLFFMLLVVFALIFVGYVGYVWRSHPNSTIPATLYRIFSAPSASHNEGDFRCASPKTYCSQMSSCSEALFHQERCGATEMDGDRDGISCEQQWCN